MLNKNIIKNENGSTTIEAIITTVVLASMILAGSQVFLNNVNKRAETNVILEKNRINNDYCKAMYNAKSSWYVDQDGDLYDLDAEYSKIQEQEKKRSMIFEDNIKGPYWDGTYFDLIVDNQVEEANLPRCTNVKQSSITDR